MNDKMNVMDIFGLRPWSDESTLDVCFQIASAGLLEPALADAIHTGGDFDLKDAVSSLIYSARDAEITTRNDPASTWHEKRLACA
jgi:hypothetical protein